MKARETIAYINTDFPVGSLDDSAWQLAPDIEIGTYWSGESAPEGRHFTSKLLWSDAALYVRFDANQREPLIVSSNPRLDLKTHGLWDCDVCEIYIAPEKNAANRYFEFEVAPTGEWIDLGIEVTPVGRVTDQEYTSGMQSAARIETHRVVMAIKIEWTAFGRRPKPGDVWLGNLYRCVGKDPTRGYLAWQPTLAPEPGFHVPERFGEFEFVK